MKKEVELMKKEVEKFWRTMGYLFASYMIVLFFVWLVWG